MNHPSGLSPVELEALEQAAAINAYTDLVTLYGPDAIYDPDLTAEVDLSEIADELLANARTLPSTPGSTAALRAHIALC